MNNAEKQSYVKTQITNAFFLLQKLCEKPTPLGMEWIAQNKKRMHELKTM